jgi:hypothetical protein
MKIKNIVYLFIFLISFAGIQAQEVRFETKVSKKKLGVNERLRVDFEMNQDGDNFTPPDFQGFRVVGGPNQAISNSWINGKRSFSKTYSYFLQPKSKGTFTIKQATIEINGQTYKTQPVTIEVTNAVDKPKDGNNADYLAEENVHLVAEVSKTNPYLNEAITVTYKLYVSNEVSITSRWREIDIPKYADFWSQNIDNQGNLKVYNGTYKGEDYRYVVLRKTILYPQKTGKLIIDPLVLDVPIDVQTNKRDFFGRFITTRVNKTISAGKVAIQVKPLPQKNKPEDFTGAVGDFTFEVFSDKTNLDANESLKLTVKVAGKGNLKLFDLPKLTLPASLEVYEPVRDNKIRVNAQGMQGSIADVYTVVPQAKGVYPIRPIRFSYFDPKSETYKSITSKELVITVENGPVNTSVNTNIPSKQNIILPENKFKYIQLKTQLKPINKPAFFGSTLFWVLLVSPLFLIPFIIFLGNKRREIALDVEGNKLRSRNRLAKKYLSEAKKNLSKTDSFYEALERALHNYLKAKLNIETADFSKEKIYDLLQEKNIDTQTIEAFISLLKTCEMARYSPTSKTTMQSDFDKAVAVISNIDKQLKS